MCQRALCPFGYPAEGNAVPLWTPHANRDAARPYWMTQSQKAGAALLWKPPVFSRCHAYLQFDIGTEEEIA